MGNKSRKEEEMANESMEVEAGKEEFPKPTITEYQEEQEPSPSSKSRNLAGTIFTCTLLGATAYLTWKYALNEPKTLAEIKDGLGDLFDTARDKWDEWDLGNFTNVLDNLDDFSFGDLFNEDPKQGDNTTLTWDDDFVQIRNGGLHLTLRNALDDTWQDEFDSAVADWQESDALVLTAEKVEVDHDCERVDGVMVVCNANFGATGWVGINENMIMRGVIVGSVSKMNEYYLLNAELINENMIMRGVIVGSVSKMNEYYLLNAEYDQRRYTMCHELGHGFGLPHTDENPYNANLGDCLDYTDDPDENLYPGEVNMRKLSNMYLTKRRRRVQEDGTILETTHLIKR
eukprot:CAMPEP_0196159766 /NCGR_PEP_ID=MMETSP0910-20130528/46487_1 /TAXON_ID=49265 /ORGANISM="Thalassiosira rotula, Strain GSO102" /LENGTH=343 /DNA_ID=CAMNT_0041424691 /DNA_START=293 /DNA_END=1325 /DNA_ORIENTATION=-